MLESHYKLTDQGHAFENGNATFLAQIRDKATGNLLSPEQITAIRYTAYCLDSSDPEIKTVVPGHERVSLTISDVFFAVPKIDGLWDHDSIGYNFKHEPIVTTHPVFPIAGRHYRIEYRITLDNHPNEVIIRYRVHVV